MGKVPMFASGRAGDDGFCENYEIAQFPAHIAQSVEHFLGKEEVTGSIPVVGSMVTSGRTHGVPGVARTPQVRVLIYI